MVEVGAVDLPALGAGAMEDQVEPFAQVQAARLRLRAVALGLGAMFLDYRHDVTAEIDRPPFLGRRGDGHRTLVHGQAVEVRQGLLPALVAADAQPRLARADPRPGQLCLDGHPGLVQGLEADDGVGGHLDVETAVLLGRGVADDPLLLEVAPTVGARAETHLKHVDNGALVVPRVGVLDAEALHHADALDGAGFGGWQLAHDGPLLLPGPVRQIRVHAAQTAGLRTRDDHARRLVRHAALIYRDGIVVLGVRVVEDEPPRPAGLEVENIEALVNLLERVLAQLGGAPAGRIRAQHAARLRAFRTVRVGQRIRRGEPSVEVRAVQFHLRRDELSGRQRPAQMHRAQVSRVVVPVAARLHHDDPAVRQLLAVRLGPAHGQRVAAEQVKPRAVRHDGADGEVAGHALVVAVMLPGGEQHPPVGKHDAGRVAREVERELVHARPVRLARMQQRGVVAVVLVAKVLHAREEDAPRRQVVRVQAVVQTFRDLAQAGAVDVHLVDGPLVLILERLPGREDRTMRNCS